MTRSSCIAVAMLVTLLHGPASEAVSLNPRGLGEVLIYPYYTVNKNQDTLVSVGNSTQWSKAITVVVREGMNGRPVLYFTLYLSPYDVWTARISATGENGGAFLVTQDASCTSPALPMEGTPFWSETYAGPSLPADGGPTGIERTREGMIEFIELARANAYSPLDQTIAHNPTGHPNEGVPECDAELLALRDGENVAPPNGGLFGAASIVNVAEGTYFGYIADALAGFSDTVLPPKNDMPIPIDEVLAFANSSDSVAGGAKATLIDGDGRGLELDYAQGIDAVSAVFMAESIVNEYLVADSLGASTDWIVTFPTRAFLVDAHYSGSQAAHPPFVHAAISARSDVIVHPSVYDQEESQCPSCTISPPIGEPPVLHWQVNAISFQPDAAAEAPSAVLGSKLTTRIAPYGDAGLALLGLGSGPAGQALPGGQGDGYMATLYGMPVTGFMVYNIINANAAPGRLANYGGAFPHRATMLCFSDMEFTGPNPC